MMRPAASKLRTQGFKLKYVVVTAMDLRSSLIYFLFNICVMMLLQVWAHESTLLFLNELRNNRTNGCSNNQYCGRWQNLFHSAREVLAPHYIDSDLPGKQHCLFLLMR